MSERTNIMQVAFTLAEVLIAIISDVKQTFYFRDDSVSHRQERVRENKMFVFAFTLAEVFYSKKLYLCAFTLAEVLIVLGIIGLIADMTIPTLHQNITEKVAVSKLKKAHATLENSFRMAVNENGTPDTWGFSNSPQPITDKIGPYLNIVQDCKTDKGCFPQGDYRWFNNKVFIDFYNADDYSKIKLADGVAMAFTVRSGDCSRNVGSTPALQNECGLVFVDTNGDQKPNVVGKDAFFFHFTKYGIVPTGVANSNDGEEDNYMFYSFEKNCKNIAGTYAGRGCTAWVIYNENMDYLHCNDLSWDGKKQCK